MAATWLGCLLAVAVVGASADDELLADKAHLACAQHSGSLNRDARLTITKTAPPYALCCRRRQLVDNHVRKYGRWADCDHLPALMEAVAPERKRRLFVDVGANIGACSMLMAANGHRVVAFEPVPQTFRALASAFAANNFAAGATVTLVNAAASASEGTSSIVSKRGNAGHSVTTGRNQTADGGAGVFDQFDIVVTTLDDVVREPVDVLKIDTQGHELKALLGARRLLGMHGVRAIAFEFAPSLMEATGERDDPAALLRLLEQANYSITGHPTPGARVLPQDFAALVETVRAGVRTASGYRAKWIDLVAIKEHPPP